MSISVIGAGTGRTGTYSLKLALERIGFGPCHHMEEVLYAQATQVPLWAAATGGRADWGAIYRGYNSAVDWPTATFYRELNAAYPTARFVLTERDPENWTRSFSETIYKLISGDVPVPPEMQDWLVMGTGVIAKCGFVAGLGDDELVRRYVAHNESVRAAIPPDRLLVFRVKDGWEPLCRFLGVAVPDEPFPRTNDRAEFWDRVSGKK